MGDDNTKFFHQSIKHRVRSNSINMLHIGDEVTSDQSRIREISQEYYMDLLCTDMENRRLINMNIIQQGPVLTATQQKLLTLSFTEDEIKKTMWSIPEDKALGLDGFNSGFYKTAWPVVGTDVIRAIQVFFNTGTLPTAWNITAITLIPKSQNPMDLETTVPYPAVMLSTNASPILSVADSNLSWAPSLAPTKVRSSKGTTSSTVFFYAKMW